MKYAIVAGNENKIFDIDENSGYVKVVQGHLLNYQIKRFYHLVIQAKDGKYVKRIKCVSSCGH